MRREDLAELHYITPIVNVPSILHEGILSHRRAMGLTHQPVAMQEYQGRRARVRVLARRPLHQYANLYFHARNPMMYLGQSDHPNLCVLRVNTGVLDLPGVVVADRDAASKYARFGPVASILENIDYDLVFAESWDHLDYRAKERSQSAIKCAEVLVPVRVAPDYVLGAYVSGLIGWVRLAKVAPSLEATINADLFIKGEPRPWWKIFWWWWTFRSTHKRRP